MYIIILLLIHIRNQITKMFGAHQLIILLLGALGSLRLCTSQAPSTDLLSSVEDLTQPSVARLEHTLQLIAHQHTAAQALFRQRFYAVGQSIGPLISDIGILGNIRWVLARIESLTRDYWNDMWSSMCELNASAAHVTRRRFDELESGLLVAESDSVVYQLELVQAMRETVDDFVRATEDRLARFLPRVFDEMLTNIDEVRRLHRCAIGDRAVDRQPAFMRQFQCGFSVILQSDANFWSPSTALLRGSCNRLRALVRAFVAQSQ